MSVLVADVLCSLAIFQPERSLDKSRTTAYWRVLQVVENEFCKKVWLKIVLEVREAFIKAIRKEVSDAELLVGMVLENQFVVEVLNPLPENSCVIR